MGDLVARRIARQRKILENAETRLKKLTGVEDKSDVAIEDFKPIKYDKSSYLETSDTQDPPYLTEEPSISTPSSSGNAMPELIPNGTITPSDSKLALSRLENPTEFEKVMSLVMISVVANILLFIANTNFRGNTMFLNNIFLPFIGYQSFNFHMNKKLLSSSTSLTPLLLLLNIRNHFIHKYLKYIQYVAYVGQDICIYFFTFVTVNYIFKFILLS